jgi:hypothetical protein
MNRLQTQCGDIISSAVLCAITAGSSRRVNIVIFICKCTHTNFHPFLQLNKVMAVPQLDDDLMDLSAKLSMLERPVW